MTEKPDDFDPERPDGVPLPAFLEGPDGSFRALKDCSDDEIEAHCLSLMLQTREALDVIAALHRYMERR